MVEKFRAQAGMLAAIGVALAGSLHAGNTNFDANVVLGTIDSTDWTVTSFAPAGDNIVSSTGTGNPNPTISLKIGKRYKFNNTQLFSHPFMFEAQGSPDVDLLIMGGNTGTLEGDSTVDWFDDNTGNVYFNLSPTMADAMVASTHTPGYRCNQHSVMTGPINFVPVDTALVWSTVPVSESFERAIEGTSIDQGFLSWTLVGGGPLYTAQISKTPAGAPGWDGVSTRWLKVTDTDTVTSSRVYSPTITVTPGVTMGTYMFVCNILVESFAPGTTSLIVSQHNDAPFKNLAGIELTDLGASAIIVGTTDGGIGAPGASTRSPLFTYGTGGFAMNEWISVLFLVDINAGTLDVSATPPVGSSVNTQLTGLAIQSADTTSVNNFRCCIRNNAAGSMSTIDYDNLTFVGSAVAAEAKNWQNY